MSESAHISHSSETVSSLPRAIIGLGENIKIGSGPEKIKQDPYFASVYSLEVAAALAKDWHDAPPTKKPILVFSGGHTSGESVPSEAAAMADFARYFASSMFHEEIPENHIVLEELSKDTSTQAEELQRMLEGKVDIDKVVAGSFHVRRTRNIFNAFKAKVGKFVSAEDEISDVSPDLKKAMKKQKSQFNFRLWPERFKEFGLNMARYLLLDPKQKRFYFLIENSRS